jgi:hypothetical protein
MFALIVVTEQWLRWPLMELAENLILQPYYRCFYESLPIIAFTNELGNIYRGTDWLQSWRINGIC